MQPTIVTPKEYKLRFMSAMERYFPLVRPRYHVLFDSYSFRFRIDGSSKRILLTTKARRSSSYGGTGEPFSVITHEEYFSYIQYLIPHCRLFMPCIALLVPCMLWPQDRKHLNCTFKDDTNVLSNLRSPQPRPRLPLESHLLRNPLPPLRSSQTRLPSPRIAR